MSVGSRCWDAEVVGVREAGQFQVLTVSGSAVPARPGQFAAVRAASQQLLRRQMWLDRSDESPELLDVVAASHHEVAGVARGDRVNIIAPLGRPFSMPREVLRVLLIGFGPAVAALPSLAAALVSSGCRVSCLLFGEPLYALLELRRLASSLTHEPQPGSADAVRNRVEEALESGPDLVYSSGSASAIADYVDLTTATPHQVAVEMEQMCGIGVCHGCVLPIRGNDTIPRLARVCREGAVFHAHHVMWTERDANFEYLLGAGE